MSGLSTHVLDTARGRPAAGMRVTVELLKSALRTLTRVDYDVPEQDLSYSLSRMPTRPRSGFVIEGVRR